MNTTQDGGARQWRRWLGAPRVWAVTAAVLAGLALTVTGVAVRVKPTPSRPVLAVTEQSSSDGSAATTPAASSTAGVVLATGTAGVADQTGSAASGRSGGSSSGESGAGGESIDKPPVEKPSPSLPNPTKVLDKSFGEGMFPEVMGGLTLLSSFESGEDEVAAVYKGSPEAPFDLLRMTVRRTASKEGADAALVEVQSLFPNSRLTFAWGGRSVAQATALAGAGEEQSLNLAWVQGRYVIDASVFPPYPGGIDDARSALLGVVGGLPY